MTDERDLTQQIKAFAAENGYTMIPALPASFSNDPARMDAPPAFKLDLSGRTFGSWTVLRWGGRTEYGKQMWVCRCACGFSYEVESYNLTAGRSLACRPCSATAAGVFRRTHGQSCTKLYYEWRGIKTRCYNQKSRSWKNHGGRGVTLAPEWLNDFAAFAAYVGEPPTHLHVVGRIDPVGNYEPGNVRWMTQDEAYRRPGAGK